MEKSNESSNTDNTSTENRPGSSSVKTDADRTKNFFEHKKKVAEVKHKVLIHYYEAWLAILSRNQKGSKYNKLVFVDGFSGPGIYDDGNYGSPALVYKTAITHTNLRAGGPEIYLIYIEKKTKHCQSLLENLLKIQKKNSEAKNVGIVKFMVIQAEFANAMPWILSETFQFPKEDTQNIFTVPSEYNSVARERFITQTTPILVFADPFGFSGKVMPMQIMQNILKTSTKAEILLNLMTGSIRRFFDLDSRTQAINLLVGVDINDAFWKPIVLAEQNTLDGIKVFLQLYDKKIAEPLPPNRRTYTNLFWMRDHRNVLIYNLYFVGQHPSAFKYVKIAMESASESEKTFKFSAFNAKKPDPEIERVTMEDVEQLVKEKFNGKTVLGKEISDFLDFQTETLHQKYRVELKRKLEEDCVSPNKSKRQKFDDMMYTFPSIDNDSSKK